MSKSNGGSCCCAFPIEKDKEMMNNLVKYVMGKPFPHKHNVMHDIDERYGMGGFTPSEIFESTKGPMRTKRIGYFITFQDLKKAKYFSSEVGKWKPEPRKKSIYDANKRHIGNIKIWWYYYNGKDKPSEWHLREYYLAHNYVPQNKVERNHVLITLLSKTLRGKSDEEMMDIAQQHVTQSLQALQLQES